MDEVLDIEESSEEFEDDNEEDYIEKGIETYRICYVVAVGPEVYAR